MKKQKILFIFHPLLNPYLDMLVALAEVHCWLLPHEIPSENTQVHKTVVSYTAFGLEKLCRALRLQTHVPRYIPSLRRKLARLEPIIVVASEVYHWHTLQLLRHVRCQKVPTQFFIFSEMKQWPKNPLSRLVARIFIARLRANQMHLTSILVYSPQGKTFFDTALPGVVIIVCPVPIDEQPSRPRLDANPLRPLAVLMNARYISYKRHIDAFMALRQARTAGLDVTLSCIGRSGDMKEDLAAKVCELGLEGVVTFIDSVPYAEMGKIYSAHDVLLLPSYNEAVGMVVPEAMSYGLPTITSDTVGANVYVTEGVTGFIFETSNVTACAEAILRFRDKTLLTKMSENAQQAIVTQFTREALAPTFQRVLLGDFEAPV